MSGPPFLEDVDVCVCVSITGAPATAAPFGFRNHPNRTESPCRLRCSHLDLEDRSWPQTSEPNGGPDGRTSERGQLVRGALKAFSSHVLFGANGRVFVGPRNSEGPQRAQGGFDWPCMRPADARVLSAFICGEE